MKVLSLLFFFLSITFSVVSQGKRESSNNYAQKINGNWMKDYIDMKDGSSNDDPTVDEIVASMLIFRKTNTVTVIQGKEAVNTPYEIFGDTLLVGRAVFYKIEKLTDYELVFTQILLDIPDYQLRRYHYLATKESSSEYFDRRYIKANLKVQSNGDSAYAFSKYIFPKFKVGREVFRGATLNTFEDVYQQSYEAIETAFGFPLRKKGNFKVAFMVTKNGMLKDVTIKQSSDSTYNDRLMQAVFQTRKQWIPADIDGKRVNVVFNYEFNFSDEKEDIDSENDYFDPALYTNLIDRADKQFEKKNYVKAIKLYTKCILLKDDAFDALYKRADAYFALKIEKNACSDWNYLATKGQKKAEALFIKNCLKP